MTGVPMLALAGCGRDPEPAAQQEAVAADVPVPEVVAPVAPATPDIAEPSAGGEAHVHGAGEFAVAVDGDVLTVTLDAPLANFGLGEGDADTLEVSTGIGDGLVRFEGGANCQPGDRHIETRTAGDHSGLTLTLSFTCTDIEKLEGVRLNAFSEFTGFETVNAIFIGPDAQVASVLTAGNPELSTR
tara:strand:- start:3373 stop:3930 length:558 start_codon:yes stop_codon:yes gene_type:complete